jgi:aldose 1-epimerase
MTPRAFGTLPSGETVDAYTLSNASGASLEVLTYGGIVTALRVPDRRGQHADVVLGFDRLEPYLEGRAYMGAIIGRIAGRIRGGVLDLQGRAFPLARNEGGNHLHGGNRGLDKRIWTAEPLARPDGAAALRLRYTSPDGEEGYPGNLVIAVTYTLTAENGFLVESEAVADRPTPLSLAHHSYFNLAGEGSGEVLGHEFEIYAKEYVPADDDMALSGRPEPAAGSASDFGRPRRLADVLAVLPAAHGDAYLLGPGNPAAPSAPRLVARVTEGTSGRVLEVSTDEACLQFYTGAMLDGLQVGRSGRRYGPFSGFCLECQGYPGPSFPNRFGDSIVRPGSVQRRRTAYAFSAS